MKEKAQRQYEEALMALKTLEEKGFQARLAGGCVRDRLMSVAPKDFDIATNALPEVVSDIFAAKKLKVVPTGIDHGTVTLVMPSGPIEITTLRKDVETDGRRAKVKFDGATFEEDAARRDFTVNAMYEDAKGQVFDYFEGRKALKEGKLVFVGDPKQRIEEDYLRILRLFRFWARLGFLPDEKGLAAAEASKEGLKGVSAERITSELMQLLGQRHCEAPLRRMVSGGILGVVIPVLKGKTIRPEFTTEIGGGGKTGVGVADGCIALARLASLFFEQIDVEDRGRSSEDGFFRDIANNMRLSHQDGKKFAFLLSGWNEFGMTGEEPADRMAFLDRCEENGGEHGWSDLFLPFWTVALRHTRHQDAVTNRRVLDELTRCETETGWLRRSRMPLTGHDIMAATGLGGGAELGQVMEKMLRQFRNGVWATKEDGLAILQEGRVKP